MRACATDNPVVSPSVQTLAAAEELALNPDSDDVALELHECIVWSSGTSFAHQLPDAFISTAATC